MRISFNAGSGTSEAQQVFFQSRTRLDPLLDILV